MRPANRRQTDRAVATRSQAGRRGGFTLVEMMVSVTLVMLMMLMFAEIFGLAQETISKQKGIATNDQKARILAEVLRGDLQSRTFRNVYPFKTEMAVISGQPATVFPISDASGLPSENARQVLAERRGYLSFSENDPNNDGDDILQLTVNVTKGDEGEPGNRIFGKATTIPGNAASTPPGLVNGPMDGPEYDDGRLGDASGASPIAEVAYFLRYGNLYRGTLLIRKPYLEGDERTTPPFTGTQGQVTPDGFPADYGQFWNAFDYSAYRDAAGVQFHGENDLSNNPVDNPATPYTPLSNTLYLPRTLAAPQMRFGFSITPHGQPLEFADTLDSSVGAVAGVGTWPDFRAACGFFGRFTTQECSDGTMTYPGNGFAPFNAAVAVLDSNGNGVIDQYEAGSRRGVDLMLANVHSFDIKVWDDILGQYVDLGYGNPADTDPTSPSQPWHVGRNPYTGAFPQFGFYHISRLRTAYKPGTVTPADQFHMDYGAAPPDFGNRYDTWCPNMWIPSNASAGGVFPPNTDYYRTGRAPYRPLQANPDPNTAAFNRTYEPSVKFGDNLLDDDGDGTPFPIDTADTDAEAPLRSIRITIRYLDPHSGQTRQTTIEQSLID